MNQVKILVPPGIGDIYWVLVKLRGFLAANDIKGKPAIWIDAPDDRRRSQEFVERIPWVDFGGYYDSHNVKPSTMLLAEFHRRRGYADEIRQEAYGRDGRHAFRDVYGFDWFLSFNGSINHGRDLDEIEPTWPTNWDLGLRQTFAERVAARNANERFGRYVVAPFFGHGFYRHWLRELRPDAICDMLRAVSEAAGARIVLTGASWDDAPINRYLYERGADFIDSLVGQTTLEQFFGVVRGAAGVIGFPAGNTMMAAVFGRPTLIIWNDFFPEPMHRHALAPDLLGRNYLPGNTKAGGKALADMFVGLVQKAA